MKKQIVITLFALLLFVPVFGFSQDTAVENAPEIKPLVVFLVRHAEKVNEAGDPALTPAGAQRAEALATMLRDAGIEHVLSTDYIRTRNTAAPAATALGLEIELYNPRDLAGLASQMKNAGGRFLVVGHSNTTPVLVELLGGDPGTAIDEKGEYDRLYIVTIAPDGTVHTLLLRFGEPFIAAQE